MSLKFPLINIQLDIYSDQNFRHVCAIGAGIVLIFSNGFPKHVFRKRSTMAHRGCSSIILGFCQIPRLIQKFDQIQTLNSHFQLSSPFEPGCFQSLIKQIHFGKIPPERGGCVDLKANIAEIIRSKLILLHFTIYMSCTFWKQLLQMIKQNTKNWHTIVDSITVSLFVYVFFSLTNSIRNKSK